MSNDAVRDMTNDLAKINLKVFKVFNHLNYLKEGDNESYYCAIVDMSDLREDTILSIVTLSKNRMNEKAMKVPAINALFEKARGNNALLLIISDGEFDFPVEDKSVLDAFVKKHAINLLVKSLINKTFSPINKDLQLVQSKLFRFNTVSEYSPSGEDFWAYVDSLKSNGEYKDENNFLINELTKLTLKSVKSNSGIYIKKVLAKKKL